VGVRKESDSLAVILLLTKKRDVTHRFFHLLEVIRLVLHIPEKLLQNMGDSKLIVEVIIDLRRQLNCSRQNLSVNGSQRVDDY
jgi:hypothetical protein